MPTNHSLPKLPTRSPEAHKGNFGTVLVVGGCRGMAGAVGLAGMTALRGGAGRVRLAVAEGILSTVAAYEPSYMTAPLPQDDQGRIDLAAAEPILELAGSATVVALGPGLGRSAGLDKLVGRLYRKLPCPMVVDADALNALATQPEVLAQAGGPRVLTPHPGEFARLIGEQLDASAREDAAAELAARCGVVIVLKSHRSLITDGKQRVHNTTGNPGMATGGTGDVLTGLIAALIAQDLTPFDAAHLGSHLHGTAGDAAVDEVGQVSLIAADLIEFLPEAFAEIGAD